MQQIEARSVPDVRLRKLLKYGTSYADDRVERPPVGVPADFVDAAYIAKNSYWIEDGLADRVLLDTAPIPHEDNLRHFPNTIKVFANNANPSLPLPDQYFDLITGYSVFTHLNEPELHWLLELRRILKIGGVAYLSFHDETVWKSMSPSLKATVDRFRPDIASLADMPKGKTVVTFRDDDPYNCNVFHASDYLTSVWGRFFEICEVRQNWVGQQAVAVLRRRE